jgi:hypothetical protein
MGLCSCSCFLFPPAKVLVSTVGRGEYFGDEAGGIVPQKLLLQAMQLYKEFYGSPRRRCNPALGTLARGRKRKAIETSEPGFQIFDGQRVGRGRYFLVIVDRIVGKIVVFPAALAWFVCPFAHWLAS